MSSSNVIAYRIFSFFTNLYTLIWFGLIWFYGISTTAGYQMPNPVYIAWLAEAVEYTDCFSADR